MFEFSENAQHLTIAFLAALSLILAIVLVAKKKSEGFQMVSSPSARQRAMQMNEHYAAPSPYNSLKENYGWAGNPYPLISTMSNSQVQASLAQPQCAQALNAYCPLACSSQNVLAGQSFANQLQNIQDSCGKQFPALGACAMKNSSCQTMPMILGGTHANKYR